MNQIQYWIVVLCILAPPKLSNAQDVADANQQRAMERIATEVEKEMLNVYRNRIQIQLQYYQEFFDLGKEQLDQLNSVANELAKEEADGHPDIQLESILARMNVDTNLRYFSVNGQLHAVDETDDPAAQTPRTVIQIAPTGDRLLLQWGSGASTLNSEVRVDLRTDKRWRNTLGEIGDEQMRAFHEASHKRRLQQLLDFVEIVLAAELLLSQDQIEPTREWLQRHENIEPPKRGTTIYAQARNTIHNLSEAPPDCFSEAQRTAYRTLNGRMKVR